MDRRDMLVLTGSLAVALKATPQAMAAATDTPAGFKGPYIDLTTAKGNVNAAVRIDANLDESKQKWSSVSGIVCGVREGEALKDLFGFEVVSVARNWAQPDGSHRVLHREAIFYSDLATGDILRSWKNPYIDETVEVVDVINDPWNHFFAEQVKVFEPDYGGLNKSAPKPPKPFTNNFVYAGNGIVHNRTSINLYYKAALQPDKWPRESAGPIAQVSEFFAHHVKAADMQNPKLTTLDYTGTWNRITPWLPWMLMGQAPGQCLYRAATRKLAGFDEVPQRLREHVRAHYPAFLTLSTPEEEKLPPESSYEVFKATRKPQPP